jgi:hypothetical protein
MKYVVFDDIVKLHDYLEVAQSRQEDIRGLVVDVECTDSPALRDILRATHDLCPHALTVGFNSSAVAAKEQGLDHVLTKPTKYFSFKTALSEAIGINLKELVPLRNLLTDDLHGSSSSSYGIAFFCLMLQECC